MATALALALVLGSLGTADEGPGAYDRLVDRFRGGDGSAVSDLAAWHRDALKAAAGGLRRRASREGGPETIALGAAALLHTEAAFALDTPAREGDRELHMSLARNLIEEARRFAPPSAAPSGPPSFECRWSLAVAYYFLQTTRFRPGLDLSRDAERPCAGEAGFWLARGALHELLSGFGGAVPQVAPETVAERLEAEPGEGRQGALARFCLRRALEIAEQRSRDSPLLALPDLDAIRAEAHLRLGRILAVAGRADEGARELSWVLDHDLQAERLYLAHLFLGVIHEGRGQTAEAALRYRTAAALMPAAQSARLALSFLKILEGSPAAARDELLRTIHSEPQSSPDAWLLYNVGTPIWGLDRVMRDLYGALGIPTPR